MYIKQWIVNDSLTLVKLKNWEMHLMLHSREDNDLNSWVQEVDFNWPQQISLANFYVVN